MTTLSSIEQVLSSNGFTESYIGLWDKESSHFWFDLNSFTDGQTHICVYKGDCFEPYDVIKVSDLQRFIDDNASTEGKKTMKITIGNINTNTIDNLSWILGSAGLAGMQELDPLSGDYIVIIGSDYQFDGNLVSMIGEFIEYGFTVKFEGGE